MRLEGTFRGEISSQDILTVGNTTHFQVEVTVGILIISGRFRETSKYPGIWDVIYPMQ
jgi:cytoskeletal protein CcmA (bactofilin family)